jgi:hypothetical protein
MKNNFINSGSGKTIKIEITRTGKSNKLIDSKRNALNPGKRISKNGNTYYEKRVNRSDMSGKNI